MEYDDRWSWVTFLTTPNGTMLLALIDQMKNECAVHCATADLDEVQTARLRGAYEVLTKLELQLTSTQEETP